MRLPARTALALACPLLHVGLIDAECKHNEHAFLNTEIERRSFTAHETECGQRLFNLLLGVKSELQREYQTLGTTRK